MTFSHAVKSAFACIMKLLSFLNVAFQMFYQQLMFTHSKVFTF